MIILLTGGSKSGKSSLAERLCTKLRDAGPLCYIATMKVVDAEDRAVVQRHQAMREGRGFIVSECEGDFSVLSIPPNATVLLEDLPNALANAMFGDGDIERLFPSIERLAHTARHLILITNELSSDGIRYDDCTNAYIRALGKLNSQCAGIADAVIEVVAGIPVMLKGTLP